MLTVTAAQAVEIRIADGDNPGEGLNDPTPRAPVGGNPGVTVGEQRRNALQFVANLLGNRIASDVPIVVEVKFSNLNCEPNNADLAAAGPRRLVSDVPGGQPGVFYALALANAINGSRIQDEPPPDILAEFNAALDAPDDCLGGADWYYGLDNDPPDGDLNFVTTAAHELIHGLGFASFADLGSGEFFMGLPSVYETCIADRSFDTTWPGLTNNERMASAENDGNVIWVGPSISSRIANGFSSGVSNGRLLLYAPNPFEGGSSISHWDDNLTPNALMEPFVDSRGDVDIRQGIGVAACVLADLGWTMQNTSLCSSPSPDGLAGCPVQSNAGISPPDSTGGDGGGGGCSLARGALDPIWLLLLLAAAWRLRRSAA
ncbi:MAG: JDVT-CTERM domain-containing protein [Salinisphaeraceae bacterium]